MTLFDPDEPDVAVRAGPSLRVRLVVAYDGLSFHGFARNEGVRTVGGDLTDALARFFGVPVELTCAGRTDKGVHARAQVVTFDVPEAAVADHASLERLHRSLNSQCGPEISVSEVRLVPGDFDARFSATHRRYRYTILNQPWPDPFWARTAWHVPDELSWPSLELACDPFIGEHDFSAFCRKPRRRDGAEVSLVRRVTSASWSRGEGNLLYFEIEATAFCHQMVRSIVGTIVDVGRGRIHAGELLEIIRSRDRQQAADLAPPQGLMLWSVGYPGWESGPTGSPSGQVPSGRLEG